MDSRLLVERFYGEIWNRRDYAVADQILAADFRFRGSLGSETIGVPAFLAYVDAVHAVLENYRCTIEELIADEHRASARLLFAGRHRGSLLGVAATGREVAWAGAAFFTITRDRIESLWVLGDIAGLKQQLGVTGEPSL
ncbi:MAG TPA: ester cyclase [Rhizomicrobium sp.]|jgi:steroid delta-isomerase-like uncharacterized protein|nr:ester cyclase [Rhizomicrobium sp.]